MKSIELLAPAGSMESLQAAVLNGADAVYFGGNKFSARAYASNFDEEAMIAAVDYCHIYGVKVYITLNTLIKQSEISEAIKYIDFLYRIGVDALIIQDFGVAHIINSLYPDFEVHASTQMTIHNAEGALFLKERGFKRIVLSRELSLEEIRKISVDYGIETEIFVHGALCICYSGQCLMSSIIGGRSGNRGRCAQPCRLPYSLVNKLNGESAEGYLLSPKDICTLGNLKDIVEGGTTSLKIEGRMKRPEYVAGVVGIYRRAIETLKHGNHDFKLEDEMRKLHILFNREGFSKAYLFGNTGRDMMAYKNPKNTGLLLGKTEKDGTIILKENIHLGDGISSGEEGFSIAKILKNGREVLEAGENDRVKLLPGNFRSGQVLYKTSDLLYLKELAETYSDRYSRKLELDLTASFRVGHSLELKTVYNGREYFSKGDMVQEAIKKPVDKAKFEENLRKTGDTVFEVRRVEYEAFEEGFMPLSQINACRRDLMDEIINYEKDKFKRQSKAPDIILSTQKLNKPAGQRYEELTSVICVVNKEQLRAAEDSGMDSIALDVFKRESDIKLEEVKKRYYLKLPNIIKNEFEQICSYIEKNKDKIRGLLTANLGIINRFKGKMEILGDYKLNIFNSYSLDFFKGILSSAALSVELNKGEIKELSGYISKEYAAGERSGIQMMVYGKNELMVSEYCPTGSTFGQKSGQMNCKGSCTRGEYVLRDRKGVEFTLRHDRNCRSYIYNSVPLNLIPHIDELVKLNIFTFRLDFIDEDYDNTLKIIRAFQKREKEFITSDYTKGHYKRGVE